MDKVAYNFISVILLLFAIGWTIFIVLSSWGTECFNMLYTYITLIALVTQLIWDNFIKPFGDE